MSRRILLLITLVVFPLITPAPIRAWQMDHLGLKRIPIPAVWHVVQTGDAADFDGDGVLETLVLINDRVIIRTGEETRWQSPQGRRITQSQIADLNRDGQPEAVLLVWRPFKPWPVDAWLPKGGRISSFHDANGQSCHIILIGWKQGAFRELWAGSALADPVNRFAAIDLAGDGRQVLVTLEGRYDDAPSVPARRLKVWEWNGFGFTVVHELEDSFSQMYIARTKTGRVLILTD